MLKKLSYLTVVILSGLFAEEKGRWDSDIVPLSSSAYYVNRFDVLRKDVDYRFFKYFGNYAFSTWQADKTEDEIKEEFLKLTEIRGNIWFDANVEAIERGWREDFRPCFELMTQDIIRCPNCVTFDYNKVGNYYNASLIEVNDLKFVALEGPLDKSVQRFFYALLDTNAPLLVRLTAEKENDKEKCSPYWKGHLLGNNQLAVPRHHGSPKNIYYLATDEWTDHSALNVDLLLDLILKARAIYDSSKGPIAVHCSGGVGRTGTFIAAYCLIDEINAQIASGIPAKKIKLSIESIVAKISLQRYHMVGNPSQYLNLYELTRAYLEKVAAKS